MRFDFSPVAVMLGVVILQGCGPGATGLTGEAMAGTWRGPTTASGDCSYMVGGVAEAALASQLDGTAQLNVTAYSGSSNTSLRGQFGPLVMAPKGPGLASTKPGQVTNYTTEVTAVITPITSTGEVSLTLEVVGKACSLIATMGRATDGGC